ncbi:MAG: histidine--tRNA ligase [Deltaproteobacteria bacterium]|nr:histidine--tRNA ligase [Deltaproteobacteria bacterium]
MKISRIRGFRDVVSPESDQYEKILRTAESILKPAGFERVFLPILEPTELFSRTIGETTDIVEKEMYTLMDRNEESLTLRPEGTAGAVRAYIEHSEKNQDPTWKIFYYGPMFRHERPQKGRQRQFYQLGVEIFGWSSPWVDAELLSLLQELWSRLGLKDIQLRLNSLGCSKCRTDYRKRLMNYLLPLQNRLCADCQRRIERNPLRVFDCKQEGCRSVVHAAPKTLDSLCEDCKGHRSRLLEGLKTLQVSYEEDPSLVRGLDYYTRTAFEYTSDSLGAQNAIAAGGRYDDLVSQLGGRPTPAIGVAAGLERLSLLLQPDKKEGLKLFVAALGERAAQEVVSLIRNLRNVGISVEWDSEGKSLKSQMRRADRLQAHYVLILGDQELQKREGILRDLQAQTQESIPWEQSLKILIDKLGSKR